MIEFDPEKYRARIEESGKRFQISARFEEPDRVPISISVSGSFFTRLFGFNIRDYYTDMDVGLEVDLRGLKWAYEELQDDRSGYGIGLALGPVSEGIYFDCPIEYPDDTSPRIVPKMKDPAGIEKLEIPDPAEHEGVLKVYRIYEELKSRMQKINPKIPVGGGLGIHPPLSCACAIMEPVLVYEMLVTEKKLMHKFFSKLLEAFIRLHDFQDKYFGTKTQSIGLADDNSAFISNDLYREMVMPYNMAIYERYGQKGRHLHADGPNDHHFRMYADDMKLTSMDIGGFSDIVVAKKALHGKTVFSGGLNCKDLYYDFETAKPAVDRAIRIGAPGGGYTLAVGGETYVGVNPEALIQVVKYAKKVGRYPIKL